MERLTSLELRGVARQFLPDDEEPVAVVFVCRSGRKARIDLPAELARVALPVERGPHVSDECLEDCLSVLRRTQKRHTVTAMLDALSRAGSDHADGVVRHTLAYYTRTGVLANRQDVRPKGYGLPEWD